MAYATGKAGCRRDLDLGRGLLIKAAKAGDEKSAHMLDMTDKGEGIFSRKSKAPRIKR